MASPGPELLTLLSPGWGGGLVSGWTERGFVRAEARDRPSQDAPWTHPGRALVDTAGGHHRCSPSCWRRSCLGLVGELDALAARGACDQLGKVSDPHGGLEVTRLGVETA